MKKEEIEVKTVPAILYIPNNAVKLTISADIIDENDEMHKAEMILRLPEIMDAHIEGVYWEDENVKYCLTDEAKTELEAKHG